MKQFAQIVYRRLRATSAFSPLRLFAGGEQGVWYDPSDFSTMFQDSAGTTPVTAVEQPVGLMLDKSGRGNHASQSTPTARPVLKQDANGKYYLFFDGTDDSMATATINPGAVDKAQVFAGMRNLLVSTATNYGCVVEYSANLQTNNGVFTLFAPDGLGGIGYDYTWSSKGTSASSARVRTPNYVAPRTTVTSGLGDVSGDSSILRLNGAQVSQSTTDQGTGNYLSYPLYIGRRGGSTLPFNGHLYSLVVRFSATNLPDATIAQTETWVAGKTGIPIVASSGLIWDATADTYISNPYIGYGV